jgi:hypothetical protein
MSLLAFEGNVNLNPPTGFENLQNISFGNLVGMAISFILIIAAVAFFFMLVLGGIKWITSGGDKGKTEGARNQITAGLVGLVIVFAAWAILTLIESFFGVNLRSFQINTTF